MSRRKMAFDIANWYVAQYSRSELEQFCFDRMVDEYEAMSERELNRVYGEVLKAKQDLADHMEPK